MLRYKVGVANTPEAGRAMAEYVLAEPLQIGNEEMARYYRGETPPAPKDLFSEYGDAVLEGRTLYSDAMDELTRIYLTLGGFDPAKWDKLEDMLVEFMEEAIKRRAAAMEVAEAGGTVARVRRDLPDIVGAGLGITSARPPAQSELANLLNGLRADGTAVPGKQVQSPMRSLANIFGLSDQAVATPKAVDNVLNGLRADGTAIVGANNAPVRAGVVKGATKRFLALYGAKEDASADQITQIRAGRMADGNPVRLKDYARKVTATKPPVAYVDLVLSADKSLSVAWALADTEAERGLLLDVHRDAVDSTMAYIESVLGYTRRGKQGAQGRSKGSLGWVSVDHYTARPVAEIARTDDQGRPYTQFQGVAMAVPDPLLHTHTLLFGSVFCDDQKVGSIDLDELDGRVKEFGAVYQAFIARGLRRFGVEVDLDATTGAARLLGVPLHVRDHYSKRSHDGHRAAREFATAHGEDWDTLTPERRVSLLQGGIIETRNRKTERAGGDDFAAWRKQAVEDLKYHHRTVLRPGAAAPELAWEDRRRTAYERTMPLLEDMFKRRAKISGQEMREVAARGLIVAGIDNPAEDIAAVTKGFRERGVQNDGAMTALLIGRDAPVRGKERWSVTTEYHEQTERELVRLAMAAHADRSGVIPKPILDRCLAEFLERNPKIRITDAHWERQRSCFYTIGEGGRLAGFIGAGGAGKTTVLEPYVSACHAMGKTTYGIAMAWAHTSGLHGAGIKPERRSSMRAFFKRVEAGRYKLNDTSVVIIDEFGRMGSRDMLDLMRLQAKHRFEVKFVGDPQQCQSVDAPVFGVLTKAFPEGTFPEISTTRRMASERNQEIATLLRAGEAVKAIDMKREDGTIRLIPGGKQATVDAVAQIWRDRIEQNAGRDDYRLTVSAPTNADAHAISLAIRAEVRSMGRLEEKEHLLSVTDSTETDRATLALSVGDHVRLYDRIYIGPGMVLGNNSDVVEVVGFDVLGLMARNKKGQEGLISYGKIKSEDGEAVRLGYGYARTIDSVQSVTSTDHINAFPSGSAAADTFKGYTGDSRAEEDSIMVINEAAERRQVFAKVPMGVFREITEEDVFDNICRNLSRSPEKPTALEFIDRARDLYRGTVMQIRAAMVPVERAKGSRGGNPVRVKRAEIALGRQVEKLREGHHRETEERAL